MCSAADMPVCIGLPAGRKKQQQQEAELREKVEQHEKVEKDKAETEKREKEAKVKETERKKEAAAKEELGKIADALETSNFATDQYFEQAGQDVQSAQDADAKEHEEENAELGRLEQDLLETRNAQKKEAKEVRRMEVENAAKDAELAELAELKRKEAEEGARAARMKKEPAQQRASLEKQKEEQTEVSETLTAQQKTIKTLQKLYGAQAETMKRLEESQVQTSTMVSAQPETLQMTYGIADRLAEERAAGHGITSGDNSTSGLSSEDTLLKHMNQAWAKTFAKSWEAALDRLSEDLINAVKKDLNARRNAAETVMTSFSIKYILSTIDKLEAGFTNQPSEAQCQEIKDRMRHSPICQPNLTINILEDIRPKQLRDVLVESVGDIVDALITPRISFTHLHVHTFTRPRLAWPLASLRPS